jgi:hypothetical protein
MAMMEIHKEQFTIDTTIGLSDEEIRAKAEDCYSKDHDFVMWSFAEYGISALICTDCKICLLGPMFLEQIKGN